MKNLYTLNQQYHEQKNRNIYVVRLSVRVSKDDFYDFTYAAKSCNGYYSSYYGVNGFVFFSEQEAETFINEIEPLLIMYQNIVDSEEDNNKVAKCNYEVEQEGKELDLENKGGLYQKVEGVNDKKMDYDHIKNLSLKDAIVSIMKSEGKEVINDMRFLNILNDCKFFKEYPWKKHVLKTLLSEGYLLSLINNKDEKHTLISRFAWSTGIPLEIVESVTDDLSEAINHFDKIERTTKNKNEYQFQKEELNIDFKFMGLAVSSKYTEFRDHLTNRGFSLYWGTFTEKSEKYLWGTGKFININSCDIKVYYDIADKIVYKIQILKDNKCKIGGIEKVYQYILNTYQKKYINFREETISEDYYDYQKRITFDLSPIEKIILTSGPFKGNLLTYINLEKQEKVMKDIEKKKLKRKLKTQSKMEDTINLDDI